MLCSSATPSTGKTTLACELANRYQTVWMPEYGREYWEQNQSERRLSCEQLVEIALGHRQREDTLVEQANRFLFIDTDATTTLQFSYYYHDRAHPQLISLANEARQQHTTSSLSAPDIPYDDTWDRSGDANRMEMHSRIVGDLVAKKKRHSTCLQDRLTSDASKSAVLSTTTKFHRIST